MSQTTQDGFVIINKKICSTTNSFKSLYIIGALVIVSVIVITYLLSTYYLKYENIKRNNFFIEGSYQGITTLILKDLEVIFDESQSLGNLVILTNYDEIKNIENNLNIIGNVLYITRGQRSLIFDLSQLNSLLVSVLGKDYFYKISLNNQLLTTNSSNKILSYCVDYKIKDNQIMSLSLELKETSNFTKKNQEIIQQQNILLIVFNTIIFFSISVVVFYIIKFWKKTKLIKKKIQSIELIHKRNIKYLSECNNLFGKNKLPILVPNLQNIGNKINIRELIEEIQVIVEYYTIQYPYKYKLDVIAEQELLNVPTNSIVFKQLIISLIYNLLYFMRGGTHTKQFIINISNDRVSMHYDSFAAKEEHMCNWSNGIFEHLGNPYILDCKKIFEQIKKCNLNYKIDACQGKNKIIIKLKEADENHKIIQFKKNI